MLTLALLIVTSILLCVSLCANCFQYLAIKKLQSVAFALYQVASKADEFLHFLAQSGSGEHPAVSLIVRGEEMKEMLDNRINALTFSLQDACGNPRIPMCDRHSDTEDLKP